MARYRQNWSSHLPWGALVVTIVLSFSFFSELTLVVAAVALGCCCRGKYEKYASIALFWVLASMVSLLMNWKGLGGIATLQRPGAIEIFSAATFQKFSELVAAVSMVSVGMIAWVTWQRLRLVAVGIVLRDLLLLNIALVLLFAVVALLYHPASHFAKSSALLGAIALFISLTWDILTSGYSITNVHGRLFPRHSRLLLFFAYIMGVVTAVVFFRSLHLGDGQSALVGIEGQTPSGLINELGFYKDLLAEPELIIQIGIRDFGVPALLTVFVFRFAYWTKLQR